ncbi:hypothetical protein FRC03_011521 [Tulasnella sp. 419]|nr:hypothetical protein FRC03_011521 [Tulasnella sp. 419]
MHLALQIPELVIEIFKNCDKATLYQLALVCRAFATIALDILWKEREVTFQGLFHLFPSSLYMIIRVRFGLYKSPPIIHRLRKTRIGDWKLLKERGPQIHHLAFYDICSDLGNERFHQRSIMRIQCERGIKTPVMDIYPQQLLPSDFTEFNQGNAKFPNLESLVWFTQTEWGITAINTLLSPKLRSTKIGLPCFSHIFSQNLHSRLDLEAPHELELMLWDMETVSGSYQIDDFEFSEVGLLNFLQDFVGLEKLTLSRDLVSNPILETIARLPNLSSLSIRNRLGSGVLGTFLKWNRNSCKGTPASLGNRVELPSFPSLQALELIAKPEALAFLFSQYIDSARLATLKLTITGNRAEELGKVLVAIAKRCPHLSILQLLADNSFYDYLERDAKSSEIYQKPHRMQRLELAQLDMQILKPLLDLDALEELVLVWPFPIRIDAEKDIHLMANSWPRIKKLHLSPAPFFIPPERPRLYIEDLEAFTAFRELRELGLFLDAAVTEESTITKRMRMLQSSYKSTESIPAPAPAVMSDSLRIFDPGRSWINDVGYAAEVLSRYFPRARLPDWTPRTSRWREVDRLLEQGNWG